MVTVPMGLSWLGSLARRIALGVPAEELRRDAKYEAHEHPAHDPEAEIPETRDSSKGTIKALSQAQDSQRPGTNDSQQG